MKTYFPAALNVHERPCLVIGAGREADDKLAKLKRANARVRHVSLEKFRLKDLNKYFFVVFCPQDEPVLMKKVAASCRKNRVLLCAIDQPEYCDVVNVSSYDKGLLRITAATQGAAPVISRKIREGLEESLRGIPVDGFLDNLAQLRKRLKKEVPNAEERIQRLIAATQGFKFRAKMTLPRNWAQLGRKRNS